MTGYTENDWWSFLSHSHERSLAHSWGKKPEQKAAEKEYNHEYYEKNKERILAARKKNGDTDHHGKDFDSEDDIDPNSETKELEDLVRANEGKEGDSDAVRQHNQNIIDNIKALSDKVKSYIKDNPEMSSEQRSQLLASLRDQIDRAKDLALNLDSKSTKQYLSGGASKSSKSKSSTKSSSKKESQKKSSENDRVDWIGELNKNKEYNPDYKLPDNDFGEFYAELQEVGYEGDKSEARELFKKIKK